MKILVTGATGLVGRSLIRRLLTAGHEVRALARSPAKVTELPEENVFAWNDREIAPAPALLDLDAVVHLAGEPIAAGKWTPARKQRLRDSRVTGTKNLLLGIRILDPRRRPRILVSASATGYYGDTGETEAAESSPPGNDFLAAICREWEGAAAESTELGLRTVFLRTGLVLAREGGALAQMGPVVLGSGRQWLSWIHLADLTGFIELALREEKVAGPYNLVSPSPVRNAEFAKTLARARGFPFVLPVPAFALRLALGELAAALLTGQRVRPAKALRDGFRFAFPHLPAALADLYGNDTFLDDYHAASQFVPLPREQVFSFFSRPENLEAITPPWLNFHLVRASTPAVEKNSLLDYRLRIRGVPARWRTLISRWNPPQGFVDEQLRGPYSKWRHVHAFEPVPGGTLLHDEVTFRVPGWYPGKFLLTPWIRRDVASIFGYRQKKIRDLWRTGRLV